MKTYILVATLLFGLLQSSKAQSLELALSYYRHDLNEDAKKALIDVFYGPKTTDVVKAEALYWLGNISFEEGKYKAALDDWRLLIKQFPQSSQAKEITERLDQMRDVFTKVSDATLSSSLARSSIRNGDFWSNSDRVFHIDSSWLQNVELANQWYDKVISEFKGTEAAELGYQRKLFTLLGWETAGRYPEKYGVKGNFQKYMPQVLEAFSAFAKEFPTSSHLQGFRYQIAQAYWRDKDWGGTREWLEKIIEAGKGKDSFYTKLAEARLKKVEY